MRPPIINKDMLFLHHLCSNFIVSTNFPPIKSTRSGSPIFFYIANQLRKKVSFSITFFFFHLETVRGAIFIYAPTNIRRSRL